MRKVVLVSRLSAGYDTDRFVFIYDDLKAVRFYGSRLTNEQAKSLFEKELTENGITSV